MAILGILSGCRSASDLERFAKLHHQVFAAALYVEMPKAPCDSTFLYLFERVELEQLFGLLREWMLAQIPDPRSGHGSRAADLRRQNPTGFSRAA
jgi:hypothetical protein